MNVDGIKRIMIIFRTSVLQPESYYKFVISLLQIVFPGIVTSKLHPFFQSNKVKLGMKIDYKPVVV
jgi:hypothetical protein